MAGWEPPTMGGIFEGLDPWVPPALVPPDMVQQLHQLNLTLPAGLAQVGGLECRLTGPDPFEGWILGVGANTGGREILAEVAREAAGPGGGLPEGGWRQISTFAEEWADPDSPLHHAIHDVWLEYDPHVLGQPSPVPGLFFNTGKAADGTERDGSDGHAHCRRVLAEILPRVQTHPLPPEGSEALDRCFQELPEGGSVTFIALMLSREKSGVRLMLSLPRGSARGFLDRIGWGGPSDHAEALLTDFTPRVDEVFLHLDVAEGVLPRLGVECVLRKRRPQIEPRWYGLLDHLVEMGLCTGERKEALLSWPGQIRTILPAEIVPTLLLRGLSHVKLVCGAGFDTFAKGYMGFRQMDEAELASLTAERAGREVS